MNILRIDSSLFAEAGASHQLADELVHRLLKPDDRLISRDLAAEGVPHLDSERIQALATPTESRSARQHGLVAYADDQIAQVKAADVIILAAPMYNFSVPSVLKAWFDHIARAGVTFEYTRAGARGLLTGKRVYIITTRGGLHRGQASDTQIPLLSQFLSFLGIDDVRVIYAERLNMGNGQRERGLHEARRMMDAALAA